MHLQQRLRVDNIIKIMLESRKNWAEIDLFADNINLKLREEEELHKVERRNLLEVYKVRQQTLARPAE